MLAINCVPCDRVFANKKALNQHLRDSPVHARTVRCDPCDRVFVNEEALKKHLRDSPAHARTFSCGPCDQVYVNEEALKKHVRDSPAHARTFSCDPCDRVFVNEEALNKHLRDSAAHAPAFDCTLCNRVFISEEALNKHLRDSPIHQPIFNTPLDNFFRLFPTFDYDPSLSPSISYQRLQRYMNWQRGDLESDEAWIAYQDALVHELQKWYGSEDDLTAWHALCKAIGIDPLPLTCALCEKAARQTHVNIVDLVEWARSERVNKVRTFPNLEELQDYTVTEGKVFRNTLKGGNVVLRHLLRKIFRA